MVRVLFGLLLATIALSGSVVAQLVVPAATAYIDPDTRAVRVSAEQGISRWRNPQVAVRWFGQFQHAGDLQAKVRLILRGDASTQLKMTIADQSQTVTVPGQGDQTMEMSFGTFAIPAAGYQAIVLESLNPTGTDAGNILELVLDGPAAKDAHFNLQPRRNSASVHLMYPVPKGTQVSAFYCEMTGVEDPLFTYYMACGWHRGYFGMQVNSPTERRIIFSVWDSGGEAVDRDKVGQENRVTLVSKGKDVVSGDFGNEGTGGHSHLKYAWKTGERQRFLVTAEPVEETFTIFSGYYFLPDLNEWMLISSWKAPKEGGYLRGLYSFSENFVGTNGHLLRKALYGNQWIRTAEGEWIELTTAKFSHDATGKRDRRDRFMGLEDGQFFLSQGGFVDGFTDFGTPFTRPATGHSPAEGKLPTLPGE